MKSIHSPAAAMAEYDVALLVVCLAADRAGLTLAALLVADVANRVVEVPAGGRQAAWRARTTVATHSTVLYNRKQFVRESLEHVITNNKHQIWTRSYSMDGLVQMELKTVISSSRNESIPSPFVHYSD